MELIHFFIDINETRYSFPLHGISQEVLQVYYNTDEQTQHEKIEEIFLRSLKETQAYFTPQASEQAKNSFLDRLRESRLFPESDIKEFAQSPAFNNTLDLLCLFYSQVLGSQNMNPRRVVCRRNQDSLTCLEENGRRLSLEEISNLSLPIQQEGKKTISTRIRSKVDLTSMIERSRQGLLLAGKMGMLPLEEFEQILLEKMRVNEWGVAVTTTVSSELNQSPPNSNIEHEFEMPVAFSIAGLHFRDKWTINNKPPENQKSV